MSCAQFYEPYCISFRNGKTTDLTIFNGKQKYNAAEDVLETFQLIEMQQRIPKLVY